MVARFLGYDLDVVKLTDQAQYCRRNGNMDAWNNVEYSNC